jgi:hypothetical protein
MSGYKEISREGLIDMLEEANQRLEDKHQEEVEAQKLYTRIMEEKCPSDEVHCTCVPVLRKQILTLEQRNELLEAALEKVLTWSKAYPLDVFPEPDMKFARQLLEAGGLTIDAVSASNMRHVLTRIKAIISAALNKEVQA